MSCSMIKSFSKYFLQTQLRRKTYYVTTPIFYVNAPPHIGHLYTVVMADAACRWKNLKSGDGKAKLVTGTDEHGLKVSQAAYQSNQEVYKYCNALSNKFKDMYSKFNIDHHDFIRTTESRHILAVQSFWNALNRKGYIYRGNYEGWYSTIDEAFISPTEVVEVKDESGVYHVHAETNNKLEWTKEVNYKFRLSLFSQKLRDWIESNPDVIKPCSARNAVLSMINEDLPDLSISRDRSRVPWGVEVPHDSSQTIYVWLDALVNYLTACGYPDHSSDLFVDMWPPDVHLIGIDIVKFHALYWPAFLMAAGLDLPKKILVHSHWTINNVKMSKSKGNVVDPIVTSERMTASGFRYFLLRQGVLEHNCNYSELTAFQTINADLANDVGNCLYRATAKHLNPQQTYPPLHKSVFPGRGVLKKHHIGDDEYRFIDLVRNLPELADQDAKDFHFFKTIFSITSVVSEANLIIQRHELWTLDQSKPEQKIFLQTLLHCIYEGLRVCGILLQPFIPSLAATLLARLAVPDANRSWDDAKISFTELDGVSEQLVGKQLGKSKMFFKRLPIPSNV